MNNAVDVFNLAKQRDPAFKAQYEWRTFPLKLIDMTKRFLKQEIKKDRAITLSNWEVNRLSNAQISCKCHLRLTLEH